MQSLVNPPKWVIRERFAGIQVESLAHPLKMEIREFLILEGICEGFHQNLSEALANPPFWGDLRGISPESQRIFREMRDFEGFTGDLASK